ncbi:histidine triad nucleotide-binding protein [Algiphilus aromaticivorans]|jgi:histidine triad (HIT) family protein|uniref:histidine triad nucleotide-binding protein n=1 Tax=Algiphilus aromaticivorans TaxID=382454 RepID=UPI0005C14C75|nr:histidine triad nucleotide-binding protein [Algiphilus aromaticivorans]
MSEQDKTLFQKIIDREIPGTIVHEDEHCVAFRDVNPGAPTHILLVPRKPIPRLCDSEPADQQLLGHMMLVAPKIAADEGFGEAFRLVVNNGAEAGQSVFHLHLHILAGRPLAWPPG